MNKTAAPAINISEAALATVSWPIWILLAATLIDLGDISTHSIVSPGFFLLPSSVANIA